MIGTCRTQSNSSTPEPGPSFSLPPPWLIAQSIQRNCRQFDHQNARPTMSVVPSAAASTALQGTVTSAYRFERGMQGMTIPPQPASKQGLIITSSLAYIEHTSMWQAQSFPSFHIVKACDTKRYRIARRPKIMPSSGPKLMVVRARRRAGACTLLARGLRDTPLLLRTRYTAACAPDKIAPVGCALDVTCTTGDWAGIVPLDVFSHLKCGHSTQLAQHGLSNCSVHTLGTQSFY